MLINDPWREICLVHFILFFQNRIIYFWRKENLNIYLITEQFNVKKNPLRITRLSKDLQKKVLYYVLI